MKLCEDIGVDPETIFGEFQEVQESNDLVDQPSAEIHAESLSDKESSDQNIDVLSLTSEDVNNLLDDNADYLMDRFQKNQVKSYDDQEIRSRSETSQSKSPSKSGSQSEAENRNEIAESVRSASSLSTVHSDTKSSSSIREKISQNNAMEKQEQKSQKIVESLETSTNLAANQMKQIEEHQVSSPIPEQSEHSSERESSVRSESDSHAVPKIVPRSAQTTKLIPSAGLVKEFDAEIERKTQILNLNLADDEEIEIKQEEQEGENGENEESEEEEEEIEQEEQEGENEEEDRNEEKEDRNEDEEDGNEDDESVTADEKSQRKMESEEDEEDSEQDFTRSPTVDSDIVPFISKPKPAIRKMKENQRNDVETNVPNKTSFDEMKDLRGEIRQKREAFLSKLNSDRVEEVEDKIISDIKLSE